MATEHTNLIKLSLISLSKIPFTRAWQNDTGVARSMDGMRTIRYGLKGSSDIIVISKGRFIGVEIKIGKDKQSDDQRNFQRMIESCGGLYFVIKSKEDLERMIESL